MKSIFTRISDILGYSVGPDSVGVLDLLSTYIDTLRLPIFTKDSFNYESYLYSLGRFGIVEDYEICNAVLSKVNLIGTDFDSINWFLVNYINDLPGNVVFELLKTLGKSITSDHLDNIVDYLDRQDSNSFLWRYISIYSNLSDDFIIRNISVLSMYNICMFQKVTDNIIDRFHDILDWDSLCFSQSLSNYAIKKYESFINFSYIFTRKESILELDEELIQRHLDINSFDKLIVNRDNFSLDFLSSMVEKFKNYSINWKNLIINQKNITYNFLFIYLDSIDKNTLFSLKDSLLCNDLKINSNIGVQQIENLLMFKR